MKKSRLTPYFSVGSSAKDHITKAHIMCISQCMGRTYGPSQFCSATTCAPIQTQRPGISRSNAIQPPITKTTSMLTMRRNLDVSLLSWKRRVLGTGTRSDQCYPPLDLKEF